MAAERQANRGIVGNDPLAFCWCLEERAPLLDASGTFTLGCQRQSTFGTRHFPEREMSVTTQFRQRTCRRQRLQVPAIQSRPPPEVLDAFEPALPASGLHPVSSLFRERLDHAHPQP